MTLRERLNAATKRRFVTVDVDNFGPVRLRSLTAREMRDIRARWTSQTPDDKREQNAVKLRQYVVAACLVDDDGNTVYTLDEVDAGALDDLDGAIVDPVYAAAVMHTGFGQVAEFAKVQDAVKN